MITLHAPVEVLTMILIIYCTGGSRYVWKETGVVAPHYKCVWLLGPKRWVAILKMVENDSSNEEVSNNRGRCLNLHMIEPLDTKQLISSKLQYLQVCSDLTAKTCRWFYSCNSREITIYLIWSHIEHFATARTSHRCRLEAHCILFKFPLALSSSQLNKSHTNQMRHNIPKTKLVQVTKSQYEVKCQLKHCVLAFIN